VAVSSVCGVIGIIIQIGKYFYSIVYGLFVYAIGRILRLLGMFGMFVKIIHYPFVPFVVFSFPLGNIPYSCLFTGNQLQYVFW